MEEINQTDNQRTNDGYKQTSSIVTVDYEPKLFMQNPLATRFINLQPYSVFTYDGNLELTPSIDTWTDTKRLPDLVIKDNSLYDAVKNQNDALNKSGIGTVWGDWNHTSTSKSSKSQVYKIGSTTDAESYARIRQQLENDGIPIGISTNQSGREIRRTRARLSRGATPPIRVRTTTTSEKFQRKQTTTTFKTETARIQNTSYGDRVVDVALAKTMRTTPVLIQSYRLKPNTRYYLYFDDVDCSDWMSIDTMSSDFPDGKRRYRGRPNQFKKGFGYPLVSDDVGTLTGVFLIPNGRAPEAETTFTDLKSVQYRTSGSTRSFTTGTKTIRLTSHPDNAQDLSQVEGYAEENFVSSGVIQDKQKTIVSTRIPRTKTTTKVTATETRIEKSTTTKANYYDPVAQTFMIDDNYPEGVFVKELDIYFKTKDESQGVEAYLVTTDGDVPTTEIIPHSLVKKNSDTILRIVCELENNNSRSIAAGTQIQGASSGARGTVKSAVTFESPSNNSTTNVTNRVYDLILSDYRGEFEAGEAIIPLVKPALRDTFTIAQDEVVVSRIDITNLGKDYEDATVEVSAPELPGGVPATAEAKFGNGMIYEIVLTSPGSGYTNVPSVVINSNTGDEATAVVRTVKGEEGAQMGICVSDDATAPTKFKFHAPVYLLGQTNYAFVIKAPTSLNFNIWTSKVGENQVGTNTRVVEQPNMGALFMSQNGGLWTEDQTQDITFRLHRCAFQENIAATVRLENAPLQNEALSVDPIETNTTPGAGTELFGDNPQIVKIFMAKHGHIRGDRVVLEGVTGNPGNIPNEEYNNIHEVIHSDLDTFTILMPTAATRTEMAGGTLVRSTYNRPYETIHPYAGVNVHGTSVFYVTNRSTRFAGSPLTSDPYTRYNEGEKYTLDTPEAILFEDTYYYDEPMVIASAVNENYYNGSLYMNKNKSNRITVRMSTDNDKVSPVLDLDRTNAVVTRNVIDNPHPNDPIFGPSTATITLNSALTITEDSVTITETDNDIQLKSTILDYSEVTKKVKLSTSYAAKFNDDFNLIDSSIDLSDIKSITTTSAEEYGDETSNRGSANAKWLSRMFIFEDPSDGLTLKLSSILYDTNDIRCYFKPRNIGFDGEFSELNWVPFNGNGLPDDVQLIKARSSNIVDPGYLQPDDYQSITWSAQDLAEFDAIAIKIVMTAENPAKAPLIDDFQLVCSE